MPLFFPITQIVAVRNPAYKLVLADVSFNQPQVTECDTLFIFCARTDVDNRTEEFIEKAKLTEYRKGIVDYVNRFENKVY